MSLGSIIGRALGKLPVRHDWRTLRLANYLTDLGALPAAPPLRDWSGPAAPEWGMYRNDQIGLCAFAAQAHMMQLWTANAGAEVSPPVSSVLNAYTETTGWDPSKPETDQGTVMLDALNNWRKRGLDARKISAYALIASRNRAHVETTVNLFGGVYFGANLPIAAQNQTVWDCPDDLITDEDRPGSWGGHCMSVAGYDATGLQLVTWGTIKICTWRWWYAYVDEAYAVMSPEWFANGIAPNGFDIAQLTADLAAVT